LNKTTYRLSGLSDDKYVELATAITHSRTKSLSKKADKSARG
jgi:hypothetical protein